MKNGPTQLLTHEQLKKLKDTIKKYPTKSAFCIMNKISPVTLFDVLLKGKCSLKTYNKIIKAK